MRGLHLAVAILAGLLLLSGALVVGAETGPFYRDYILQADQTEDPQDSSQSAQEELPYGDYLDKSVLFGAMMQDLFAQVYIKAVNGPPVNLEIPTEFENIFARAAEAVLRTAEGGEYSQVITPTQWKLMNDPNRGRIGISIQMDYGNYVVNFVDSGKPADRAGLKTGDIITTVNGKTISEIAEELNKPWGLTYQDLALYLTGEAGTDVNVGVIRPGRGALEFTITREVVEQDTVHSSLIKLSTGQTCGLIKVREFGSVQEGAPTPIDFRAVISDLRAKGAVCWIVDLIDNPGGAGNTAVSLVSQFTKEGPVFYSFARDPEFPDEAKYIRTANLPEPRGLALDDPVVVLISGSSASSSEVMAAALQDYERALIVGQPSHGKGVGQHFHQLRGPSGEPTGFWVQITAFKWESPDGKSIHGVGVMPDVMVPEHEALGEARKALEWYYSSKGVVGGFMETFTGENYKRLLEYPAVRGS